MFEEMERLAIVEDLWVIRDLVEFIKGFMIRTRRCNRSDWLKGEPT